MADRAAGLRPRALVADAALAVAVAVLQVQGTLGRVEADPETVLRPLSDLGHLGLLLLVASGAALALRRVFPVPVFVVITAISAAYYLLDFPDGPGWISLFIALYGVTAYGDGRRSLVVAAVGIAALAAAWFVAAANLEPRAAVGWVFFRVGASVMSAALGESVRTRSVIAAEALARAERAERTREEEARARVGVERLRIAREVHDTVAHALAVINVQAGVTAHLLDRGSDRTREALAAIERTSGRALAELRSVLGVLRTDAGAEADGHRPLPGLAQVPELVATGREAGLEVELATAGADAQVPAVVDAAAYRIVQEALTNVIRHAGASRVSIAVDVGEELGIRVADDGGGAAPPREGHVGRGIPGMRERCRLLGGDLHAGPSPRGGFEVTARLPLGPAGGSP